MSITEEFHRYLKDKLDDSLEIKELNIKERLIIVRCKGIKGSSKPLYKVDFDGAGLPAL